MTQRELMTAVLAVAEAAGREIMAIYEDESRWGVQQKEDDSPLTAADLAAHQCIERALLALRPDVPVLSEESEEVPTDLRQSWSRFWVVDPLDGTKEFIARNGEFSVNIALVEGQEAVLGVVYGPATGVGYVAARGEGAFRVQGGEWRAIRTRALPVGAPIKLCASRRHGDPREADFMAAVQAALGPVEVMNAGSAFKLCAVAEGSADAYPRLGPTMEWDTAAGQVVVEEAGGVLIDDRGRPFRYNARPGLRNGSFLVAGAEAARWQACWLPLFKA